MIDFNKNDEVDQKGLDSDFVGYLNDLKKSAMDKEVHPTEFFKKCEYFYLGKFDKNLGIPNLTNQANMIKPLVETKTTLVCDAKIKPSVVSSPMSLIDEEVQVDLVRKIADIIENCVQQVLKVNNFNSLSKKIVRSGVKMGPGIVETYWDSEKGNIGDVAIDLISPLDFFPDPTASTIQDCNYIFVRKSFSIFSLKKKYPDMIDEIDKLADQQKSSSDDSGALGKIKGVISGIIGTNAQQMYSYENLNVVKKAQQNIEVWYCYMKDDSTFLPSKTDSQEEKEVKERFKYPYGRIIIYAGNSTIFEDKPIDYPFGFPFDIFYDTPTNDIWGSGIIGDLMENQIRQNRIHARISACVAEFLSMVMWEAGGDLSGKKFPLQFQLQLARGTFASGSEPRILTNNTAAAIDEFMKYLEFLKNEALEIVRMNKTMISGERPTGVNSGQMVQDLNESPMASIRSTQENFSDFIVSISQKVIVLIQQYYNVPRIIRIAKGKRFAILSGRGEGEPGSIKIQDSETQQIVEELKGDLSIGEYEIDVVGNTDIPRSKSQLAGLTQQLAEQGVFGNPNDIDVRAQILESMDYPNYRAIIEDMRNKEDEILKNPPKPDVAALIDKIAANLKDMPPYAQEWILDQLGVPNPAIQNEMPPPQIPVEAPPQINP